MEHADNIIDQISYIQDVLGRLGKQMSLLETELSPVMNPVPCRPDQKGVPEPEPTSVLARLQSIQAWAESIQDDVQTIRQNLVVQPQEKKG
jgi:prefoldin subunit 5